MVLLLWCMFVFSTCQQLLFTTDFESTSITPSDAVTDSFVDVGPSTAWSNLPRLVKKLSLFYEDGTIADRFSEIVVDPENANNQVLHWVVRRPFIATSVSTSKLRMQTQLSPFPGTLRHFSYVNRMRLSDAFSRLDQAYLNISSPLPIHWMTIGEIFTDLPSERFTFRISLEMLNNRSKSPLYFHAQSE